MSPLKKPRKFLGELLREKGIITIEQLGQLLENQKEKGGYIGELALQLGYLRREELDFFLSLQEGYPYIEVKNFVLSDELWQILPRQLCKKFKVLPIGEESGIISIVSGNPKDKHLREEIKQRIRGEIKFFLAWPEDLEEVLSKL